MSNHDYLTVLVTNRPANKQVEVIDGIPVKRASQPIVLGKACARHVPDVKTMEALLQKLADIENAVLIQGYVKGTEDGKPFRIASKKLIERLSKQSYKSGWVDFSGHRYIARLKVNFTPSSWWQLDRDYAPGIPQHLAALTDSEYIKMMDTIMPGFGIAGHIRVASTSGRVLHKGIPLDSSGCRYWFQIEDPSDINFGERLKLQAAVQGLGFLKSNSVGVATLWTPFDPTVFSWERIVFDGKPHLTGNDLSLRDPDIRIVQGPRVNTSLIKSLDDVAANTLRSIYGLRMKRNGTGAMSTVQVGNLKLDTPIQTEVGIITPLQFMAMDIDKIRCQATFRDSSSWNGFMALDYQGMPILYDNGSRCRYELSMKEKTKYVFTESDND